HHARLLVEDRRAGLAARAVERAWRTTPHPELAQVYAAIHDGEAPLARVKRFERLAGQNPAARESHLALAEATLDAPLWGEARRHLDHAAAAPVPPPIARAANSAPMAENGHGTGITGPTQRLCLLMARLEEAEHGSVGGMREWLDRAVGAMP